MGDERIYANVDGREKSKIDFKEPKKKLRELSKFELAIVERRRKLIQMHMPEIVPEILLMMELGLIDDWRNVKLVKVFESGEVV